MLSQFKDSLTFLLPFFQPIFNATSIPGPIIDLGYATYEGAFDPVSNVTRFLGVRYAAPPTGENRWRPPQPPLHQEGVLKATEPTRICLQGSWGNAKTAPSFARGKKTAEKVDLLQQVHNGSATDMHTAFTTAPADEDCLFLNVYTSGDFEAQAREPKPVLVWFHGGGYFSGSAIGYHGNDGYDGKYPLKRANGGLVVVVPQYRLGMFGFLPGKEVHDAGAANAGLLDQQFALQWVQDNSSGGGSVYHHVVANGGMTSPALFDTAIISSSFHPPEYHVDDDVSEAIYDEVMKQTGCRNLDCLRKIDVTVLQMLNLDMCVLAFSNTHPCAPVIDRTFVREAPSQAVAEGRVNGKYLMAVTIANEGEMFMTVFRQSNEIFDIPFWLRNTYPKTTDEDIERAISLYADVDPIDQAQLMYADITFICPTYNILRAYDKPYRAQFAVDPALHAFDIGYYFPDFSNLFPKTYDNDEFENAFASIFTNFALAKDPNIKVAEDITPAWAPWTEEEPVEMIFGATEDGAPDVHAATTDNLVLKRCSFWQSIAPHVGQ
ncbi:alpha/beta-hydrolase [Schizophyllum commune H4-8]|uniref:alpha/beta-hydrolase n=1 Tax=Schizophyllum commune (strain H4-8 / FGSC 9210) TaxID=578458 RepID=UPI00215E0EB2|nr:alpha/beta-hydrolase [Schizophyllum commune H4-8]KAI5890824.1 alpha/beta-hydrolase [Schizophyllum commune H4-8]